MDEHLRSRLSCGIVRLVALTDFISLPCLTSIALLCSSACTRSLDTHHMPTICVTLPCIHPRILFLLFHRSSIDLHTHCSHINIIYSSFRFCCFPPGLLRVLRKKTNELIDTSCQLYWSVFILDGLEPYFFICTVLVVFWRPDQDIVLECSMLLEKVVRVGNFKVW